MSERSAESDGLPNAGCCSHWTGRHDPDDGSCDHCLCINPALIERELRDETDHMAEVLAEEFYLVVMQATADHWLTWENVPQAERSGYYDLAYEVAEKIRHPAHQCADICAPHLHQHCSPECEIECASCVRSMSLIDDIPPKSSNDDMRTPPGATP